jgi:hypothetical protein
MALTASACGGVQHATRGSSSAQAIDPTFVEVRTTGLEGPYDVVSWSAWDVAQTDPLPAAAPEDVVAQMREEAARRGAQALLLERFEDPWRKLWLGLGVVRAPERAGEPAKPPTPCAQAGFAEALIDAKARAQTCIKRLQFERPQLAGDVQVVFEVDPFGKVLRAAATPDSSRDGQLQACVLGAVHATTFGEPTDWSCQGVVTAGTAGTPRQSTGP